MGTHYYRTGERGDADLDDGLFLERIPIEDLINVKHYLTELMAMEGNDYAAIHSRRRELRGMVDYVLGTDLLGGMDNSMYVQSRVRSEVARRGYEPNSDTLTPPSSVG